MTRDLFHFPCISRPVYLVFHACGDLLTKGISRAPVVADIHFQGRSLRALLDSTPSRLVQERLWPLPRSPGQASLETLVSWAALSLKLVRFKVLGYSSVTNSIAIGRCVTPIPHSTRG